MLRRYLEAVDGFDAELVERGVDLYLTAKMPGYDGRFAPTPPMLATGCRKAAEERAQAKYRESFSTPRLPAPEITHTEEERARAKALVAEFVASVGAANIEQTTEEAKRHRERWEKVNSRFQPAMDDASIMERLLGYSSGSPESDEFAA